MVKMYLNKRSWSICPTLLDPILVSIKIVHSTELSLIDQNFECNRRNSILRAFLNNAHYTLNISMEALAIITE